MLCFDSGLFLMRKVRAGHQIESEFELPFLLNPASLSVSRPAVAQLFKNDPVSIHSPTALSISVTLVTSRTVGLYLHFLLS